MGTETEQPTRSRWLAPPVLGGAVLAVVLVAGFAVWALNRPEPLEDEIADNGVATVAAEFIDADMTWAPEDTTLGGFTSVAILGSDGAFYALSTSPSVREMPQDGSPPDYSIYRSEDGATWSENPIDGLGTDLWLRNLSEADGNLYVVSTAPGIAAPDDPGISVARSGDGGSNWTSALIDVTAREPVNLGPITWDALQPHVAGVSSFVVATASSRFFVDYNAFVPPGILTDSSYAQRTSTGIEVVDYSQRGACGIEGFCPPNANLPLVVWRGTWAEIGVQPEPDSAIETFVSHDGGSTFAAIDNPFTVDYSIDALYSVGESVVAVVRPTAFSAVAPVTLSLWRTDDGENWEQAAGLPAMDIVMSIGTTGGKLAAIGQLWTTPVIAVSEDEGSTWRAVDVTATLPGVGPNDSRWITAATIGPVGAFLSVQTWIQNAGANQQGLQVDQLLASTDMTSWSATSSSELASGGLYQLLAGTDEVLLQGYVMNGGRVTLVGSR